MFEERLQGEMPLEDDARKAALLLHALPAAERAWMMGRLSQPQQDTLRTLLEELRALGIPADPRWAREVIDQLPSASCHPKAGAASDLVSNVDAADPHAVARCLAHEPAVLVANVLDQHAWSWASAFQSQLPEAKRREVQELRSLRMDANRMEPVAGSGAALRKSDTALLTLLLSRLGASIGSTSDASPAMRMPAGRSTAVGRLGSFLKGRR